MFLHKIILPKFPTTISQGKSYGKSFAPKVAESTLRLYQNWQWMVTIRLLVVEKAFLEEDTILEELLVIILLKNDDKTHNNYNKKDNNHDNINDETT